MKTYICNNVLYTKQSIHKIYAAHKNIYLMDFIIDLSFLEHGAEYM